MNKLYLLQEYQAGSICENLLLSTLKKIKGKNAYDLVSGGYKELIKIQHSILSNQEQGNP